jgi:hypothetical protein
MFEFDGDLLVRAIRATFERRRMPLPVGLPVALTPAFGEDAMKRTQWSAFVRKSGGEEIGSLAQVLAAISAFVERPIAAAKSPSTFSARWLPGGPWK